MGLKKASLPLIAITCSRLAGGAWGIYSLSHFMDFTFSDYSQAILHSGGAPVIIPTAQDVGSLETILGSVQGLILSGGPDIHPRRYGAEPIAGLGTDAIASLPLRHRPKDQAMLISTDTAD